MNKISIIGLFVLLGLVAAVSASVDIYNADNSVSAVSGDVAGSFGINNTGADSVNVSFSESHPFNVDFTPKWIVLASGAKHSIDYDVTIPANQKMGTYQGQISAKVGGVTEDSFTLTVNVLSNGDGLVYSGGTISLNIDAGQQKAGTLVIKNQKNDDITGTYSSTLPQGITVTATPAAFDYLADTTVNYAVSVPSGTNAGTYGGSLKITYGSNELLVPFSVIVGTTPVLSASPSSLIYVVALSGTLTKTLTIRNSGNTVLNGVHLAIDDLSQFEDSSGNAFAFTFTPESGIALSAGASQSVNVKVTAPSTMASGSYSGNIVVSDLSHTVSINVPLTISIEDILQVTDVSLGDDQLKPGDEIRVEVTAENTATNVDLIDVTATVTFKSGSSTLEDDSGDKIELTENFNDLDAGDDDTVKVTATVPSDVDHGDTYTVHVVVEAKDAHSSKRYKVIDDSQSFDISKDQHQVVFDKMLLEQESVSCNRRTFLDVTVRDTGRNDEDVTLTLKNSDLGVNYQRFFELSKDYNDDNNIYSETFPIDIKKTLAAGTYRIEGKATYNKNSDWEYQYATITVEDCQSAPVTTTMIMPTTTYYIPPTTLPYVPTSTEGSFTNSMGYIVLLGAVVLLLAIIVIVLIVRIASRK